MKITLNLESVNNAPIKKKIKGKCFLSNYFFKITLLFVEKKLFLSQLPRKFLKSQNPCQIQLWSKRTMGGIGIFLATVAKSIRDEEFPAAGIPIPVGAALLWQAVLQQQSRGFVHSAAFVDSTSSRWVVVQPKDGITDSS